MINKKQMKQKKAGTEKTACILNEIDQYNSISEFLEFIGSPTTKASYKSTLKEFFKFLHTTPDTYIIEDIRLLENSAMIKALDKYSKDLYAMWMAILSWW
jgi:hypothetical protein